MSTFSLLLLSALLFAGGIAGFFVRRDLITMLLSAEIMLAGANLALLVFSTIKKSIEAEAAVLVILTVAAAEVAVALAAIAVVARKKGEATEKTVSELKG
ncbi:MAG: NADH-quinone oxidoreductase subunit NuoK [Candidatus Aminicenantes bacterium]|nr:NADH-quinone oxidoreductase subunit NuoK [Candidatus Aminicenantes bacterium]